MKVRSQPAARIAISSLIGLVLSSCQASTKLVAPATRPATVLEDTPFRPWVDGEFSNYYWVMPTDQRVKLMDAANRLQIGADVDDVIRQLGIPDTDRECHRDCLWPTQHDRRSVEYCVAQLWKSGFAGSIDGDRWLSLEFDMDGKLDIVYFNGPGVIHKEAPDITDNRPAWDWWNPFASPYRRWGEQREWKPRN